MEVGKIYHLHDFISLLWLAQLSVEAEETAARELELGQQRNLIQQPISRFLGVDLDNLDASYARMVADDGWSLNSVVNRKFYIMLESSNYISCSFAISELIFIPFSSTIAFGKHVSYSIGVEGASLTGYAALRL